MNLNSEQVDYGPHGFMIGPGTDIGKMISGLKAKETMLIYIFSSSIVVKSGNVVDFRMSFLGTTKYQH